MSEHRFIIRVRKLPTRCEICHQPDRFDPQTGNCQRCITLVWSQDWTADTYFEPPILPKPPVNWHRAVDRVVVKLMILLFGGFPLLLLSLPNRHTNQAYAQKMLREINSAEGAYSLVWGKGNYTIDLSKFVVRDRWGIFDETDSQAQTIPKNGYLLGPVVTVPGSTRSAAEYSITAYPAVKTGLWRTGDDCFYVDDSGVIRHSGSATIPADENSPPT